ncbi:MAG: trehalase family glycosidase, partial [Gemmatimonadota bacterium]|nr:trehalase family glycosidase [Gemmatimonadota bacterium]
RPDKWVLSGLDGVIWAPPFPRWFDHPGFWDPAHILHYELGPLFSVALLDGEGAEIPIRRLPPGPTAWRPDRLRVEWQPLVREGGADSGTGDLKGHARPGPAPAEPSASTILEARRVLPDGIVESTWYLPAGLDVDWVAAYTAQPAVDTEGFSAHGDRLIWTRRVADRKGESMEVRCELFLQQEESRAGEVDVSVVPSQGGATPHWSLTPFAEVGAGDRPDGSPGSASDVPAWIWGSVRTAVAHAPSPASNRRVEAPETTPAAGRRVTIRMSLRPSCRTRDPGPATDWDSYWSAFPDFATGDPYLDRYFGARIFGLGLNRIQGAWPTIKHPAIAEGIEYFHMPITYSAQCHMMEMRWRAGGTEAWGSILNFLENQKADGSLHGRLYPNHLTGTDYYHANWGDAVRAVHAIHPDRDCLRRSYEGLSHFADWLMRERDPEGSGMFNVVNHYETGQEYMSRYVAVDPEADVNEWLPRLRLKGIDVTVYAYQLFRALEWMASECGTGKAGARWQAAAERTGGAIQSRMWSQEQGLFTDVDGTTGLRTDVKAAVGFYPLLTDLTTVEQSSRLFDHLEDPDTFGTPFPIPSSSVDDPYFSPEGLWKGIRRNCPWNGRVWPMTTSHVIEGLLRRWLAGDKRAGALAVAVLTRFVRMMFDDGDPARPNCFEHYNPYSGRPCYFRGIDDYQHSWVLDLLIRGFAGLHVSEEGVTIRPLPHELPRVFTGPVGLRGRRVHVEVSPSATRLHVGGRTWETPREQPTTVAWDELPDG